MSTSTDSICSSQIKAGLPEATAKTATAEQIDAFLDDCTFKALWPDLKASLRYPQVRARLASHLWNLQDQAMGAGDTQALCEALPSRLDAASAELAINYPFKIKSWPLTLGMLKLGACISDAHFTEACEKFAEKPDGYYRLLIEWAINHQMVSWQHTLGFSNFADWQDLLTRAERDSNPVLYLVASGIMTAKQKRQALRESTSELRVLMIANNMKLPNRWREHVPEQFQAALLAYEIGI